jgi:ArsR family transcriptional regulator
MNTSAETTRLAESLQIFKAELFKALAHPSRIRILELLGDGEKSVGELQLGLGVEGSGVSQQLAVLRTKNLVATRKVGNVIYYRIHDPQVNSLLDVARGIFNAQLIQLQSLSHEPPLDSRRRAAKRS